MWRVAAVNGFFSIDRMEEVLQRVPCRADQNTDNEEEGRADLILAEYAEKGGFSCVPWTENALKALRDDGVINVSREISKFAIFIHKLREVQVVSTNSCGRSNCKRGESAGWSGGCQVDGGKRLRRHESS
jgi:hypothetical protein